MENNPQPTYTAPNKALLEKLSKWSNFVGILLIVSGILSCLVAILSLGLSLIPGIFMIILGIKLTRAKKSIDMYIQGNGNEINGIFEHLSSFFQISGIFIIVSLILAVVIVIVFIILGFAMFNQINSLYYY